MSIQRTRAPAVWLAGLACTLGLGVAPLASAAAQRPPSKVSFIDAPSSESPEARSKRLKRECKGRPNAGACLGHTQ